MTGGETVIYSQPDWIDPTIPRNVGNEDNMDPHLWAIKMTEYQRKDAILDKILEYKLKEMFEGISLEEIEEMKKALRKKVPKKPSKQSSIEDSELAELVEVAYNSFYKQLASKTLRELEGIWKQINPQQEKNRGKEPGE